MIRGEWEGHIHVRDVTSILIARILYAKIYVNRIDLKIQPGRLLSGFWSEGT